MMRQVLSSSWADRMQATVSGLKADGGGIVVEVEVGRTVVDVVVGGREVEVVVWTVVEVTVGRAVLLVELEVEVVVGGAAVVVVVLEVGVVVVVVGTLPPPSRLVQLDRQIAKALRHRLMGAGCAHALLQAPKAARVSVTQAVSPWQREPELVQPFWHAEPQPLPLERAGISQAMSTF